MCNVMAATATRVVAAPLLRPQTVRLLGWSLGRTASIKPWPSPRFHSSCCGTSHPHHHHPTNLNSTKNASSALTSERLLNTTSPTTVSTTRSASTRRAMAAPDIPTEQWAQVIEKVGTMPVYKKIAVGKPGPDEVLVNVKYSGVCHTDLHAMNGDWPLDVKMPLVGGHEGAGVVVAKGELVHDIELGDHVGIKWLNGSCLACSFCQQMDEPLCPEATLSGYTVDGSFQQYAVANAAHVARIPKHLPLDAVAPVLCAGITVYKGLKESGARPGQWVAIVGAGGGLGNMALQYAAAMGLHTIAIDAGDDKRDSTKALGASAFVDFSKSKDVVADVKAATPDGNGPQAVILLAVSERPFQQASQYVRPHGTVICIGLPANAFLKAPVFDTVVRMITIRGSYVGNRQDTAEALEFYAQGLIKAPFQVVGLSELPNIYTLMAANKVVGRYVVDTSK